jgi:prepilin-type N-terminal cleavage/methylation domain-containing protein
VINRTTIHDRQRGFSLLEFLVVMVLLAIMATAIVPAAVERVRMARVRTTVNQFSINLRAARWAAVSGRNTVEMTVAVDPANSYQYMDSRGRLRSVTLPDGVRIVTSTNPIEFRANGSVSGGSSTVFETDLTDDVSSKWTIDTNVLGVPSVQHQQVDS